MLKKSITFEDYNGNMVTEDYYFNFTKAEVVQLDLIHPEGLEGWIKRIIREDDRAKILETFKDIILSSYGEKDETGRRFIKNAELREKFEQSPAYSELYMELITDADAAADFMNGIIPKQLSPDKPELPVASSN